MKKKLFLVFFLFVGFFGWARDLSFVTWNVETFFDGINDGSEYGEFVKADNWNEASYKKRVDKLCKALKVLDSDLVVLIELENVGVLYDISNGLQDLSWKRKKLYKYSCFSKNEGASIGCGVLSRYKIKDFSIHNIDVMSDGKMPSMRPVMKVIVDVDGDELVLFVNHWKSMSGGKELTEIWRDWQESVLSSLIKKSVDSGQMNIIAAGDFNRDIKDFYKTDSFSAEGLISLRHFTSNVEKFDYCQEVKSCWYENGKLVEPGSYYFNDEWGRIDQIFYAGGLTVKDFSAVQNELWCTEKGTPDSYSVYNGKGFSDHLPLKCKLILSDNK